MSTSRTYTKDPNHWYVADFETTTAESRIFKEQQDSQVILFNVKTLNNDDFDYTNNTIDQFLDWVLDGTSKTIWFHNLSFDGAFIVPALLKRGFNLDFRSKKKNKKLEIFQQGDKIYYIKAHVDTRINNKKFKFQVIFRDSLQLLPTSINSLGKAVGIQKYLEGEDADAEFYDWEPEDVLLTREDLSPKALNYIEYCKRDVEILKRSLRSFYEMLISLDCVRNYNMVSAANPWRPYHHLTIGSVAMSLINTIYIEAFKNDFNMPDFIHTINKATYDLVAQTFRGGICQFNVKFQGEPKFLKFGGFGLDITSSYPFQMTFWLPYGEILHEIDPVIPHQTFVNVEVINLKIKPQYDTLVVWPNKGNVDTGRFLKEAAVWKGSFVKEEFDILSEIYDFEVVLYQEYYMKTAPFLANGIRELYLLKEKFTLENNPAFRLVSKLIVNSIYGKFAQKLAFNSYLFCLDELAENDVVKIGERFDRVERIKKPINGQIIGESKTFAWGAFKCFVASPIEIGNWFSNKACGSVITAKARVKLIRMMLDVVNWGIKNDVFNRYGIRPADIWLYSDTDSVFLQKVPGLMEWLKERGLINEELGGWTLEKDFVYFGAHAAKRYACLDKDKNPLKTGFAGVKLTYAEAKASAMNWDDDQITLVKASISPMKTPNGKVLMSVNKILKRGNL